MCFYFYLATVAWIVLKRFYFSEILSMICNLIMTGLYFIHDTISSITSAEL
jgi:hypothetical protein